MRFLVFIPSLLVGLGGLVSAAPNPKGSLSSTGGTSFSYTAPAAGSKNWVGLYHVTGGGPDDEKMVEQSLVWAYAPNKEGKVTLKTPVGGGKFKAYFLADDGYKWIAKPIEITVSSSHSNDNFNLATINLWHGGEKIKDYHNKQVKFITDSKLDIIGLQEATRDHAKRLGQALGWNWHQDDGQNSVGIISRFPITKRHANIGSKDINYQSSGVEIALKSDKNKKMNFWSTHTKGYPYGPYEACFSGKEGSALTAKEEEAKRPQQIKLVVDGTKSQRENTPFVLVGDFNSPSHLDWTSSNKHCGKSYAWPSTKYCTDNGLIDTFRKVHPDPKKDPGLTWSPIEKVNPDVAKGQPEPQDRIDFIFANSKLTVVDSKTAVAGTPKIKPNHEDNQWTSDHAAVITTFKFL